VRCETDIRLSSIRQESSASREHLLLNVDTWRSKHVEKEAHDTTTDEAVLLHGYGDVSRLSYEDTRCRAGAGEVLVKTVAVSINPIDWNCVAVTSRR